MFNVPYWKYSVDPKSYDKDIILADIEHNYSLDNNRNKWDGKNYLNSNLHHSNRDIDNPKLETQAGCSLHLQGQEQSSFRLPSVLYEARDSLPLHQ